jgi:thiol-disulfide isomerase/thioredoxin
MRTLLVSCALMIASVSRANSYGAPPAPGHYDAWLESRGGRVTFGLEIAPDGRGATIQNGEERIAVAGSPSANGEALVLAFDPYGAELRIRAADSEGELLGEWVRCRELNSYATIAFGAASHAPLPLTRPEGATLPERWSIRFAADKPEDAPDVGVFRTMPDGRVNGTILTTTGDWRFLHGRLDGATLELCSFSGSGATLIRATLAPGGQTLSGRVWSGGGEPRAFTATADPTASLPDAFGITRPKGRPDLDAIRFRDPATDKPVAVSSFFPGGARGPGIIHLFGTWCPNSNDAASLMNEIHETYSPRELIIVALAFEGMEDHAMDLDRIARFRAHHGTPYPILLAAGDSDKEKASALVPFIDRVHAYPTSILIDRRGRIAAIHTGYSGPATGEEHTRMRERFMGEIERVLTEP